MSEVALRVLLVDDEASLREPLTRFLRERHKFHVDPAENGQVAVALLESSEPAYDVALVDEVLEGNLSGLDLLRLIKERHPDVEVIVMTAWEKESNAVEVGAYRYMSKPFDREELADQIRMAAVHHDMLREQQIMAALQEVSTAISAAADWKEIFRLTCQAAVRLFGVDHAGIALFEDDWTRGRVEAEYSGPGGKNLNLVGITFQVRGIPFEEDVALRQQVVELVDLAAQTQLGDTLNHLLESGLRSMLLVPMVSRGRSIGSLGLDVMQRSRGFVERDKKLCQALATNAALAYDNARWSKDLERLQAKVVMLAQAESEAELRTRACQAAVELSGADHSGLVLFDPDLAWGTVVAEYPDHPKTLNARIRLHGVLPEERLVETGDALVKESVADAVELGEVRELLMGFGIQSIAVVPVKVLGRFVASFSLDAIGHRWAFTDRQVELCQMFAAQVGANLERTRLLDRLSWLNRATQAVAATLDRGEAVARIIDTALRAFPGAERSAIHLIDPKGDRLRLEHKRDGDQDVPELQMDFAVGQGMAGWVFEHGQGLFVRDASQDERYLHPKTGARPHRALMCAPLRTPGRLLGTLTVASLNATGLFSQRDLDVLENLAGLAAAALVNVRLFDETQAARDYAASLLAATEQVNATDEPLQVLQTVVKQLREAIQARQAVVVGFEGLSQPRILAQAGITRELDIGAVRNDGYSAQVFRTGKPEFFDDISDSNLTKPVNQRMLEDEIGRAACLPMRIEGQAAVGVLWAQFTQKRLFSPTEQKLLQVFADQAATTYRRACRMERQKRLQEVAGELAAIDQPARVRERIVASARWLMEADYTVLWSYDKQLNRFIQAELVADQMPTEVMEALRNRDRGTGKTTQHLLTNGYDTGTLTKNHSPNDPTGGWPAFVGDWTRELLRQLEAEAFQAVLLGVGEQRVGVLMVIYRQPRAFDLEDRAALEHFAEDAARALERARLQDRLQRQQRATGKVVYASTISSLTDTLHELVSGAKEALDCDIVTVYVYDESRRRFTLAQGIGNEKAALCPPSQVGEGSVLYEIASQHLPEPMQVSDVAWQPMFDTRFVREEGIRAVLGLQLHRHDQPIGVLMFNYRAPHLFTPTEIEDAEEFGRLAALVIRDSQNEAEARRNARALEALHAAGQAGTAALDVNEILKRIAEQALSLVDDCGPNSGCFCHVALLEGDRLRFVAASPDTVFERVKREIPFIYLKDRDKSPQKGLAGRAAEIGQVENPVDLAKDPDYICFDEHTQSQLAVPIRIGERVLGVINIESSEKRAFGKDQVDSLTALAGQAAIALRASRAYEQAQRIARISRQASQLEWGDFVDRLFTELRDVWATREVQAYLSLATYEPESDQMKLHHRPLFYPGPRGPQHILSEAAGIVPHVARQSEKAVYYAPYVEKDPVYYRVLAETRAECAVRIEYGGEVLGVLDIESPLPNALTQDDLEFLEALRDHIAVALHNLRHHSETQDELEKHTSLAWTGMVSSTWGHAVHGQAVTIRERVALLRQDLEHQVPADKVAQHLETIERLANRILERPMTPPLSNEEGAESLALDSYLRVRISQLWANEPYRYSESKLSLGLGPTATVRVSREWLRRALDILIDNAVQATTGQTVRWIRVSSTADKGMAVIEVTDNGPGISPEVQPLVLRRPIPKSKGSRGKGMGLLFAQLIVQTYGGNLRVGKTGPGGTTMVIAIPLER